MTRKRTAKPAGPPAVAPIPTQENQIEVVSTFLDTGSPPQYTGPPTTMPATAYEGLPHRAMRSEEQRVKHGDLIQGLHDSKKNMETLLRKLEDEEERLERVIKAHSKETPVATATENYDLDTKNLTTKACIPVNEKAERSEKHQKPPRDSQVLNDLKDSINSLIGRISNDEQAKLFAKFLSIADQMEATPVDNKVLLNHPDGSPNENAFEQEAAVQKMLQDISDLEANIKGLAKLYFSMKKGKEMANDGNEPGEKIKEPAREKSGEINVTHTERKEAAIKRYMRKLNIDEATARQRWVNVHANRMLEARLKAEDEALEQKAKDAITPTQPLRLRSGQSYESVSMSSMDAQGLELATNARHSSSQAKDAPKDAIPAPQPYEKVEPDVKSEEEQPAIQDFGKAAGEKIMPVDPAPLPAIKTIMYSDVSHPEEILDLWVSLWGGDNSAWGSLHEYLMGFPESTRDAMWASHLDWLTKGGSNELGEFLTRKADKLALRRRELETPLDGMQLFRKLESLQDPFQRFNYGQEDTTGLLKLREEHLHKREKQQQEVNELLEKLEKELQERESRLVETEHRVHDREIEWEKHQEQRLEIEKLLQQREEQLQRRDDQLQAREGVLQTHEDRLATREEQLLSRDKLLQRREDDAEARITLADQKLQKVQAEIKKGESELADLTDYHRRVKRSTEQHEIDLDDRECTLLSRESAVTSREKFLEQFQTRVHEQFKSSMTESTKLRTDWGGFSSGDWPKVLEIAMQVKMFVETEGGWFQNQAQLADLKKIAMEIEKEAKMIIFEGAKAGVNKGASAINETGKTAPAFTEAKKDGAAVDQWEGWSEVNAFALPKTKLEDETLPATTPVKGCTGKWGCGCTTCLERECLWNAHMPSSKKNAAGKRCKCNHWDLGYGVFVCDGGSECKDYEDESAKLPASSSIKNDAKNWPSYEDEQLPVLLKEDVVDDGW
ncbi:hypothetical protein V490_05490 [Pseudogymnoascus sp. VKM F-3557]|nr:hypothetical protein V490_05490 [Pseudogymnoascus sp. VKM F-3557]